MKKFVIITTQRTGSTVFWRYLNFHPQISVNGEIFLKNTKHPQSYNYYKNLCFYNRIRSYFLKRNSVHDFLRNYFSSEPDCHAKGFKLMYNQINRIIGSEIFKPDFYFIHLVRNNTLKLILSRNIAKTRKVYHVDSHSHEIPQHHKLWLNGDHLVKSIKNIERQTQHYSRILKRFNTLTITYEDINNDIHKVAQTVCNFLQLIPMDRRQTTLKKINPDSTRALIENYDEIERYLGKTQYHKYLD